MAPPPRSLTFAVGSSLLTLSLAATSVGCDEKPAREPTKDQKKAIEDDTVNEGPEPPPKPESADEGPKPPPEPIHVNEGPEPPPEEKVNEGPEPEPNDTAAKDPQPEPTEAVEPKRVNTRPSSE